MTTGSIALVVALSLLVAYTIYVIARIVRFDGYTSAQKLLQSVIAVLVPFFGPLVLHIVLRAHDAAREKKDERFDPNYISPSGQ
jgi:hypothetical protein